MRGVHLIALSVATVGLAVVIQPANALTMAECGSKYAAAKDAGTLNGQNWNAFRKAECGRSVASGEAALPSPTQQIQAPQEMALTVEADAAPQAPRLTLKECSVKYRAAKADGSLGERKWNEFRRAECGWVGQTAWNTVEQGTGGKPTVPASRQTPKLLATSAPAGVTFPAVISAAYSAETPARQRMRTCLENYHANKAAGTLGGLRWIQQGGGYYSLCNARLKASL